MLMGTRGSGHWGVCGVCPVDGRHMGEDRCFAAVSQLSLPSLLFLLGFDETAGRRRGCCERLVTSFGVTGIGSSEPDCRFMVASSVSLA